MSDVKRLWTWPTVLHGPPSRDPSKDGRIEVVRAEDYDALAGVVCQLTEALREITALQRKWQAPIRSDNMKWSDAKWAAVGSEADKLARAALSAAAGARYGTETETQ